MPAGLIDPTRLDALAVGLQETVRSSPSLRRYGIELWRATRQPADYGVDLADVVTEELVLAGASPRGMA